MRRVAIVQSSYIPWKGYFSLIQLADEFILYDDVQYTRRDWRNRNRIKTPTGTKWLTIPVTAKGRYLQRVRDTRVSDPGWAEKHWQTINQNYCQAPHFNEVAPVLQKLYERCAAESHLSKINFLFLKTIADLLDIGTPITWSMDYELVSGRTERLVNLCRQTGAAEYLTGQTAKAYLDESVFSAANIRVCWMDYSGYPEHRQLFSPPFIHEVSIIDLLMNEGPQETARYMSSYREFSESRLAHAGGRDGDERAHGHAFV